MTNSALSKTEITILYLTFGLLIFGIVMARLDQFWFNFTYVVEDGFIEWMTVLPLVLMLVICLNRIHKLYKYRPSLFLFSLGVFTIMCFFAAGEELSWGQRLFQWRSMDFFVQNNSQKETNFHNLVVAGKSVNLLIFSRLLIIGMVLYLIVLPILYRRNQAIRQWTEKLALPVPRVYQIISLCLVFGLISLCPSEKRSELLEFGSCFIFLAIFLYPENAHIFRR
jgi:hypothetical protein